MRGIALGLTLALAAACEASRTGLGAVPVGTWGGEDAGLVVSADSSHAHIGCTLGDVTGPIPLDSEGRFDVAGQWNVDAFPIDRGILHPARLSGRTDGRSLSLAVRLTDTGQALGPVALTLGQPPHMRGCPICRR
ncbi:MAG: hypothetical protein DMF80_21645 [Acidobacteria bacterium]|nr:MAG: hypothetical protein DMF80_21645 [Acidobacteriota bacterium]PYQ21493.1 MAG: hypothetical protein DMF81_15205 [Acidobacteriota bacterium]